MNWDTALNELSRTRTSRNWRRVFETRAQAIFDDYERKRAMPPVRRAESPNAWFKREAYQLLKHYIEADQIRVFGSTVMGDKRAQVAIAEAAKNPFKLGLLAMFSDDLTLSRGNRHIFGNQMLYAWAHDVPFDFINAFLAVTGGQSEIASKIKDREPEVGFEHRFKASRLTCLD